MDPQRIGQLEQSVRGPVMLMEYGIINKRPLFNERF
jgi:hypothetical protein